MSGLKRSNERHEPHTCENLLDACYSVILPRGARRSYGYENKSASNDREKSGISHTRILTAIITVAITSLLVGAIEAQIIYVQEANAMPYDRNGKSEPPSIINRKKVEEYFCRYVGGTGCLITCEFGCTAATEGTGVAVCGYLCNAGCDYVIDKACSTIGRESNPPKQPQPKPGVCDDRFQSCPMIQPEPRPQAPLQDETHPSIDDGNDGVPATSGGEGCAGPELVSFSYHPHPIQSISYNNEIGHERTLLLGYEQESSLYYVMENQQVGCA